MASFEDLNGLLMRWNDLYVYELAFTGLVMLSGSENISANENNVVTARSHLTGGWWLVGSVILRNRRISTSNNTLASTLVVVIIIIINYDCFCWRLAGAMSS